MKSLINRSDYLGALASALCIVHCLATPLLYAYQLHIISKKEISAWWQNLTYFFLVISFIAVYYSVKNSANKVMKIGLYVNWSFLFLLLMNEQIHWVDFPELFTYTASSMLIILHIYNQKYCRCKDDSCCTHANERVKEK